MHTARQPSIKKDKTKKLLPPRQQEKAKLGPRRTEKRQKKGTRGKENPNEWGGLEYLLGETGELDLETNQPIKRGPLLR